MFTGRLSLYHFGFRSKGLPKCDNALLSGLRELMRFQQTLGWQCFGQRI